MKALFPALLCLALALPAQANDAIDDSQAIAAGQRLLIEIPRGDITLKGGDGDQVTVRGTLDPEREAFVFAAEDDVLVIKVELPEDWHEHSKDGVGTEVTISYPADRPLALETISADVKAETLGNALLESVSGDLSVRGGQGSLGLSSVSGDIEARDLTGEVDLRTVSGDIETSGSGGRWRVESVSGDLEIRSESQDMALESVSGDIEASLAQARRLKVRTVSGDQELRLARLDGKGDLVLDSVSGDIELVATQVDNLTINAHTAPGGNIRNQWTDDAPAQSRYGNSESLDIRLGQGEGRLRLNTVSGDLVLIKR